jgi:hypothetical protein
LVAHATSHRGQPPGSEPHIRERKVLFISKSLHPLPFHVASLRHSLETHPCSTPPSLLPSQCLAPGLPRLRIDTTWDFVFALLIAVQLSNPLPGVSPLLFTPSSWEGPHFAVLVQSISVEASLACAAYCFRRILVSGSLNRMSRCLGWPVLSPYLWPPGRQSNPTWLGHTLPPGKGQPNARLILPVCTSWAVPGSSPVQRLHDTSSRHFVGRQPLVAGRRVGQGSQSFVSAPLLGRTCHVRIPFQRRG